MSKDLWYYLAESERVYEFRLKIACEPTDKQLDAMELHLRKYDAFDITTPKKTIIQKHPRDFSNITNAEIYMIDFKTRLPVSPQILLAELSQKMKIGENYLIVRNKKEPLHIEDEENEKAESNAEYKARLTDPDYNEFENPKAEEFYGEEFKTNFIKEKTTKKQSKDQTEYKE